MRDWWLLSGNVIIQGAIVFGYEITNLLRCTQVEEPSPVPQKKEFVGFSTGRPTGKQQNKIVGGNTPANTVQDPGLENFPPGEEVLSKQKLCADSVP